MTYLHDTSTRVSARVASGVFATAWLLVDARVRGRVAADIYDSVCGQVTNFWLSKQPHHHGEPEK